MRVGLAVGPVIEREGDAFGATVNLASRATAIAYPGTVVVSPELRELLERHPEFAFRGMRPRFLKHIGRVSLSVLRRADDAPSTIREAIDERRRQMREVVARTTAAPCGRRRPRDVRYSAAERLVAVRHRARRTGPVASRRAPPRRGLRDEQRDGAGWRARGGWARRPRRSATSDHAVRPIDEAEGHAERAGRRPRGSPPAPRRRLTSWRSQEADALARSRDRAAASAPR